MNYSTVAVGERPFAAKKSLIIQSAMLLSPERSLYRSRKVVFNARSTEIPFASKWKINDSQRVRSLR